MPYSDTDLGQLFGSGNDVFPDATKPLFVSMWLLICQVLTSEAGTVSAPGTILSNEFENCT